MNPQKLFVDRSIEINAPADKVWNALIKPEFNQQWAINFGGLDGPIVSDWQLGSPVRWTDKNGTTIVEGNVTALEPGKLLRFTVFDVRSEKKPVVAEEDGITFQVFTANNKTVLRVLQGDFSAMPNGAQYRDMSAQTWDLVLPMVKEFAEGMK